MPAALIRKLKLGAQLSDSDELALRAACAETRWIPPDQDLVREGERPEAAHVVLEGFACRYKLLPDGTRQIVAWLAPGDFCDLQVAILGRMDHSIGTLTRSKIAFVFPQAVEALLNTSPALSRALWWATLVDEAILREWLVGMGRRSADKQIAHLICELFLRLQAVGLAPGGAFEFPLTQGELADTVGLSSVHVNRVIQQLREQELVAWRGRTLTIKDFDGLAAFADFDDNYLHLTGRSAPHCDSAPWSRQDWPRTNAMAGAVTPLDRRASS